MSASPPPNVVLIVLDCVRSKSLNRWGGGSTARTPVLDALADRSLVFTRAVAPSNWTYPSHLTMFTGSPSGVLPDAGSPQFSGTIADWVRTHYGFTTALFTENELLAAGLGLERGFSEVLPSAAMSKDVPGLSNGGGFLFGFRRAAYGDGAVALLRRFPPLAIPIAKLEDLKFQARKRSFCNGEVVRHFAHWLETRPRGAPYFGMINIIDAHEPYPSPRAGPASDLRHRGYSRVSRNHALMVPELRERVPWPELEQRYLDEIAQADAKVGEFLKAVQRTGEADRTIVVVTADHGQCFGEEGFVYHGNGTADAVARVPLLVFAPGEKASRIDRWVSLSEIPGWIAAWAEGESPRAVVEHGSETFGPEKGRAVFCDGRPACDSTGLLRGRFQSEPWNRRRLVAYRDSSKYVADEESHSVLEWNLAEGDPDGRPPKQLEGNEARETWESVFEPYLTQRKSSPASLELSKDDPHVVAALRSWGYE